MDIWAVGCIFGELCNNSPVFPGEHDIDQVMCVYRILGSPTLEVWPGLAFLPDHNKLGFPVFEAPPFSTVAPDACVDSLDLLQNFLEFNPDKRITAADALLHKYFFSEPLPAHHSELPILTRHHQNHHHHVKNKKGDENSGTAVQSLLVPPGQLDLFDLLGMSQ